MSSKTLVTQITNNAIRLIKGTSDQFITASLVLYAANIELPICIWLSPFEARWASPYPPFNPFSFEKEIHQTELHTTALQAKAPLLEAAH